ncbi:dynamin family protein [Yoonia sp. F2084L]|uniref:dynamin family protein n=1 Tax=Yoonia sp. F2084L TaxID=2926419 RepID=UPI001FF6D8C3|nr:dynamin family protein [Yoonia sp. F2084L]MCK0095855.1 dynamin family protein [Yoonia sp. F2084L]
MATDTPQASGPRKPRIALMGEFSAGKSTLSNLVMGTSPLPEKVTATRLSPVWLSSGSDTPYRMDVDGTTEPVSIDRLEDIPVDQTRYIRLFVEADILEVCDLIDFPGISDPNMSSNVWERMLPEVDAVIWCTHATQAWRQSEAAVWNDMPEPVRQNSVLLITRFDKLTNEKDRGRVVKRVSRETRGQFGATFPVSLLQAIQAGEDHDLWEASGAGPFTAHLIDMIETLAVLAARSDTPLYNFESSAAIPAAAAVVPRRVQRSPDSPRSARATTGTDQVASDSTDQILRSS